MTSCGLTNVVKEELEKRGPSFSELFLKGFLQLVDDVHRIANAVSPDPGEVVDTLYVAKRLEVTKIYVAEMARDGKIPKSCLLPGTGKGKIWKFRRRAIDEWINSGRPGV